MTPRLRAARAFTLLELAVTLTILAILTGIAVLGYGHFVSESRHTAAGALLDRVVILEQPIARDWGSYTSWPADLSELGTDVTILNGTPAKAVGQVSIVVGDKGTLALATRVGKSECLYRLVMPLDAGGGTVVPEGIPASAACTGQSALPPDEPPLRQTGSIRSTY